MSISNKMSQEDKDKKIQEALETQDTVDTENSEEEADEEQPTPESPREVVDTPAKVEPEAPNKPLLEERYKESTRESQVLFLKNKKLTETVKEARNLPEPSEDELKAEYSEWEQMTQTEQRLAKDSFMNKRALGKVYGAVEEGDRIDEWSDKVDSFLATGATKYPRLAGKEDNFKSFAMKSSRRGLAFDDLTKLFLWDFDDTPVEKNKGSLLESGSGGGNPEPQVEYMDEKQAATLRVSNHKLYQQLVKQGKIKINI